MTRRSLLYAWLIVLPLSSLEAQRSWLKGAASVDAVVKPGVEINSPSVVGNGRFKDIVAWNHRLVGLHSDVGQIMTWTRAGMPLDYLPNPDDARSGVNYSHLLATDSALLAVDVLRERLVVVRPRGKAFTTEIVSAPKSLLDACILGNKLVFFTPDSGGTITVVDTKGRQSLNWHTARLSDRGKVAARRAATSLYRLACTGDGKAILLIDDDAGEISAYKSTGEALWTRRRMGFTPMITTIINGTGISRTSPSGGSDETVGVFPYGNDEVIVQTVHRSATVDDAGNRSYRTIDVSARSGAATVLSRALPRIVGSAGGVVFIQERSVRSPAVAVDLRSADHDGGARGSN